MTSRYLVADVFDGLATLEDDSVDLIVTSPPFLALRSYLPADHPDKAKEIGSEATPAEFIDVMLRLTAEWRRVLAPHGSIAVELGDTYAGSGGAGGDYNEDGLRDGQQKFSGSAAKRAAKGVGDGYRPSRAGRDDGWPLAKSKTLIPELYRLALAYGFNPLTGEESPAGQWLVRNVVTWCRPNPPVGALGDKWRPATSDVVVAATSPKRFWDDLATRKPHDPARANRDDSGVGYAPPETLGSGLGNGSMNPSGAPLLDYWEIPPGGYQGAHYAVFPPALVEPLVKAMCPQKVCRTCGEPSRRIVGEATYVQPNGTVLPNRSWESGVGDGKGQSSYKHGGDGPSRQVETLGFTDCGHDDYRPGHVLDCFAGSGTTGAVASGHGHDVTLIDLDERNVDLARERIGPLMFDGPIYPSEIRSPVDSEAPQTRDGAL